MNKLGIIPAAGNATRFGGLFKELLPVSNGETALRAAYLHLLHFAEVIVITTPEKIALHAHACPRAAFVLQQGEGLWGAVKTALQYSADEYYFTMPDTVWQGEYPETLTAPLHLGVFETHQPERYGVLHDNHIVDKGMWTKQDVPFLAWGAACWNSEVRKLWLTHACALTTFNDALNLALEEFGCSCFQIGDYHDFANLDYYTKYLTCLKPT